MFKNKTLMYNYEKNELLKKERGIGFEDVILSLENGDLRVNEKFGLLYNHFFL